MKYKIKQSGFTLIEMVIVVSIIAIMVAIALPAIPGMLRSHRMSSARNLVSNLMTTARNYAVKEQKYAGVCFLTDGEGRQYFCMIEHAPLQTTNRQIPQRFTPTPNGKVMALPEDVRLIDQYYDTDGDSIFTNKDLGIANPRRNRFCVIFSPSGQLLVRDYSCLPRGDGTAPYPVGFNDGIFCDPALAPATGWPFACDTNKYWSVLGFYLYQESALQQADPLRLYDGFFAEHEALDTCDLYMINIYTGTIIEK